MDNIKHKYTDRKEFEIVAKNNPVQPVNDRTSEDSSNMMEMWRQSIEGARQKQTTVTEPENAYKPNMEEDDNYTDGCKTCEKRKYQDGSNDPGVSFKTPGKINPAMSAAVVMSHEREHVVRNQAKAEREGGKVVNSTVTLHYAICPECGRTFVAGGTTRTKTKTPSDPNADVKRKLKVIGEANSLDKSV